MRAHWKIVGLIFSAAAAPGQARAATVAADLAALAGEWQGAEVAALGHPAGTFRLALTAAPPGGPLVAAGRLGAGDDGNGLIPAQNFEVVQSGGQCFALTAGDGAPESAFAVERAPFGGLRLHRLTRSAAEDQLIVQAEELVLARPAADGTRRLKVTRGDRLCRDAAGAETVCGAAESRTYTLKR